MADDDECNRVPHRPQLGGSRRRSLPVLRLNAHDYGPVVGVTLHWTSRMTRCRFLLVLNTRVAIVGRLVRHIMCATAIARRGDYRGEFRLQPRDPFGSHFRDEPAKHRDQGDRGAFTGCNPKLCAHTVGATHHALDPGFATRFRSKGRRSQGAG